MKHLANIFKKIVYHFFNLPCVLLCILVSLCCIIPANTSMAKNTVKYAILIGIADYSTVPELYSLDGPVNDIELIAHVLQNKTLGFTKKNIVKLIDKNATHNKIRKAMFDLADKLSHNRGGMVYIHYSGHGSQLNNIQAREREQFDQTWVSYGARSSWATGLDQWDILDDEIHEWLAAIAAHADQVIVVSDSCHSGSITRGSNPSKIRAARPEMRQHPLADNHFSSELKANTLFIGAARDTEQAGEYIPDDTPYGLFTWFWAQTLQSTSPGDTWQDILWKTRISVQGESRQQTPQINGTLTRSLVFQGETKTATQHYPVLAVNPQKATAQIGQGIITGATIGSVYTLSQHSQARQAKLTLTTCSPFSCTGSVINGSLQAGNILTEKQHAYCIKPVTISIEGERLPASTSVVKDLTSLFTQRPVPGYTLVQPTQPHTMTLFVATADNESHKTPDLSKLNSRQPDPRIEILLLNSTGTLWNRHLRLYWQDKDTTWPSIQKILQTISRAKEIKALCSREAPPVDIEVSTWRAVSGCESGMNCLKDSQGSFQRNKTFPFTQLGQQNLHEGDSITFSINNQSDRNLHISILNIGPDDSITVLFPGPYTNNASSTKLAKNAPPIDTRNIGRLVLSRGRETIKVIASGRPIPTHYFSQTSYTEGGILKREYKTRGADNPFNRLITQALGGKTRGQQILVTPEINYWGTLQRTATVQASSVSLSE